MQTVFRGLFGFRNKPIPVPLIASTQVTLATQERPGRGGLVSAGGSCFMPVEYSIDSGNGVVICRWIGRVTISEIIANAERLRVDPRFDLHYSELMDMSGFTGTNVTSSSLGGVIQKADPFSAGSRHAVIAPGKPAFGIARMYQSLRGEDQNFAVFRNDDDARNWLGLTQPRTS